MGVHVGELHTDIVPATPDGQGGSAQHTPAAKEPPWMAERRWAAARDRAECLARRVSAEGFDD
ncbi:hypothetical protein R8Z50_12990 [Longispora sp. K20-0274]|uniref:hypothetical protein n=1 Tax=Longispora sp. K20-0274 TaxID=3088255 RepID=UPI003999A53F